MSLIRNSNRVKQAIDFTGIQNGNIHPSDIDAVFEFDNRVLILMEVKHRYNRIPTGQKILLERICNSWHTPNNSIVLKVEHEHKDEHTDIPLDDCFVTMYYYKKKWNKMEEPVKVKSALNDLGKRWHCKKCSF